MTVPSIIQMLDHETRWNILTLLAASDYRVSELVALTGMSQNQVSYHLAQLRDADLVNERRSSADSREVYYALNTERLKQEFDAAGAALHPILAVGDVETEAARLDSVTEPVRVLFVCTHNSARSQMGEGLLNHLGAGRVVAFSAGSQPAHVNPFAIETMHKRGIDITHHQSQHVDDFVDQTFDYVITVCDSAREECPVFPHGKRQIHWSFPDPSAADGNDGKRQAFEHTARQLTTRLQHLLIMIGRDSRQSI